MMKVYKVKIIIKSVVLRIPKKRHMGVGFATKENEGLIDKLNENLINVFLQLFDQLVDFF